MRGLMAQEVGLSREAKNAKLLVNNYPPLENVGAVRIEALRKPRPKLEVLKCMP